MFPKAQATADHFGGAAVRAFAIIADNMPTIPLYTTPADPNAWHAVRAPGGFEWWQFTAWVGAFEQYVVVDFIEGDPFDTRYRDAYRRYRKAPTRNPPPAPAAFGRASLLHCRNGSRTSGDVSGPLIASAERLDLSVASLKAIREASGEIRVTGMAGESSVDLTFFPTVSGEVVPLSSSLQWDLVAPRCTVRGTVTIGGEAKSIDGHGDVQHWVSTASIDQTAYGVTWMRGRAVTADASWLFSLLAGTARPNLAGLFVFEITADVPKEIPITQASISARPFFFKHPHTLTISDRLMLSAPTVLAASAPRRVRYDARIDRQPAAAVVEVIACSGW